MNLKSSNQPQGGAANDGMSSPPALREAAGGSETTGSAVKFTADDQAEEELRWKTMLVEAQVDLDLDGVLVVDSHGEKIFQNQRHRELWKIPAHIGEDYSDQLKIFIKHTKHSDEFFKKVFYLYNHTDEVVRDEVELVDGTILDRYSSPVHDKAGQYYGRIWIFRDISGRPKLEA